MALAFNSVLIAYRLLMWLLILGLHLFVPAAFFGMAYIVYPVGEAGVAGLLSLISLIVCVDEWFRYRMYKKLEKKSLINDRLIQEQMSK